MELDSDHVDSRCAAVARVVEEIAAHSDLCAVGVLLLRGIIYTDSCIHMSHLRSCGMSLWQMKIIVSVPLLTLGMP